MRLSFPHPLMVLSGHVENTDDIVVPSNHTKLFGESLSEYFLYHLHFLFCHGEYVVVRSFLPNDVLVVFVCVFLLLSLELLCRCSSALFLSSRPRTGLATTYTSGYG